MLNNVELILASVKKLEEVIKLFQENGAVVTDQLKKLQANWFRPIEKKPLSSQVAVFLCLTI